MKRFKTPGGFKLPHLSPKRETSRAGLRENRLLTMSVKALEKGRPEHVVNPEREAPKFKPLRSTGFGISFNRVWGAK